MKGTDRWPKPPRYLEGIKIEPQPAIRERVYRYLRSKIISGEIPPGERLVEAQLAKEIGTSRTPIREALHNLEFEKIVTALPKVGYIVREVNPGDVREICEIRTALESLAVRWALRNRGRDLVPHLQENLKHMARDIKGGRLKEAPQLDSEFHDLICQASGSRWLADLNLRLREYMHRLRLESFTDKGLAKRALDGHRRILRGVEKRNAKAAERAITDHMKVTVEDIISYALGRHDSAGSAPSAPTHLRR